MPARGRFWEGVETGANDGKNVILVWGLVLELKMPEKNCTMCN